MKYDTQNKKWSRKMGNVKTGAPAAYGTSIFIPPALLWVRSRNLSGVPSPLSPTPLPSPPVLPGHQPTSRPGCMASPPPGHQPCWASSAPPHSAGCTGSPCPGQTSHRNRRWPREYHRQSWIRWCRQSALELTGDREDGRVSSSHIPTMSRSGTQTHQSLG